MDSTSDSHFAVTLALWFLLQLLIAKFSHVVLALDLKEDGHDAAPMTPILESLGEPIKDPFVTMQSRLHSFRLCTSSFVLNEELGYWVKPQSTTWFSRFLIGEYDDSRWLTMFRMQKYSVFALSETLAPQVHKKDTRYQMAIPEIIRVACTLFKLTHGVSFLICSEMFTIGKSTVCVVLRDVVHAIDDTLKHNISWLVGDCLHQSQEKFADLCNLPGVIGAVDGTHISIAKPQHVPIDYCYFKSGGYALNCQAVVDSEKRFLDLYLGMLGSTNDSRMLRRSTLYNVATHGNFFNNMVGSKGFTPYLLGDLGFLLLPWLMVPHCSNVHLSMAESVFNKKLRKGQCVVKNTFGILKQIFRELLTKSDLDVAFLPDVILCCAILHNTFLGQSREDVECLYKVLQNEGLHGKVVDDIAGEAEVANGHEGADAILETLGTASALQKRQLLGMYLTTQRPQMP